MILGWAFSIALVICAVILALAILTYRRQHLLTEMKALYLKARKERAFHYRRYTTYQADIDRLRVNFESHLGELDRLKNEIEAKKKEITDILDILREEIKQTDFEIDKDLTRIIERRKGMILKHWKELDGKKTLYLEKLKEIKQGKVTQRTLVEKKESEFQALSQSNSEIARVKAEYDRVIRSSIFSFGSKN